MFKNVTLEISLKPFKKTDDEYIKKVCRKMFRQWDMLIKEREIISIMFWSADGSELLDYNRCADAEFEWCKYIGNANISLRENEPLEISPHKRKHLYTENPPKMTYGILKRIIQIMKAEGAALYPSAKIRIGTTFDIGGEFAVSEFKYKRHPEICGKDGCQGVPFVDVTAVLNKDNHPYAAYPDGIPDKTSMGTFLGAQAREFMKDMGFEYLWLSNGVGFSSAPWNTSGKIYDGKNFHIENLQQTKENVFSFWKDFFDACPDFPVETRGTNYSVGVDYACDGVPLYDIYKSNFNITPPPNSPWAAINDNIGIEVIGQLTRNCEIPQNDYMFRFYLHDIWWANSPWYDRYEMQPYDIYIPMALSRLDEKGKVQSPSLLNLLSVDNSRGELPDICAAEITPHLLRAERDFPDEPSPIVLLYPLKEYTTSHSEDMLKEMYFGDTFLQDAVNSGVPISSVVSSENFLKHSFDVYNKSILLTPAKLGCKELEEKLCIFGNSGGKIIAYGSERFLNKIDYEAEKVDIASNPKELLKSLEKFGYSIKFSGKRNEKLPSITIHKSNNAMIFSVYQRSTTLDTKLNFPLGAPLLCGFDADISESGSTYRFPRTTHTECRAFVRQKSGIVRAKELQPENAKYRRRIGIFGLKNADICLFGEEYCKENCLVTNVPTWDTPKPMKGFELRTDKEHGTYLFGKNISGDISLCMPY